MANSPDIFRHAMRIPILPLLPNRVRRNYCGGLFLDKFEKRKFPSDGNYPEDWLASTTLAVNPALSLIPNEGLASVQFFDGKVFYLKDLLEVAPEYYLGQRHFHKFGRDPGFLAKLLDSAVRLPMQAHPNKAFARQHLGSKFGKLEAYVIIALRQEKSFIRLGFQRPPSPGEWRRIIMEQDIMAMDACFDEIPVQVGDVWFVPGGLPHAIGKGILMLEVMEPSDWVVRCEFEREGLKVPPEARFMQVPEDLALQIFDYTPLSVAEVEKIYKIRPLPINSNVQVLIGPQQTDSFAIVRITVFDELVIPATDGFRIGIVSHGWGTIVVAEQTISLSPGVRFLMAASSPDGLLVNQCHDYLEILFCSLETMF